MTLNKRGFTLVELIVVIAMIAVFMASVGTAVGKTRERARVEKARGDVKVLSQAILAWVKYLDRPVPQVNLRLNYYEIRESDLRDIGLDYLAWKNVRRFLDKFGETQFFFGSDMPMWDPAKELERLVSFGLPERTLRNILHDNFVRYFDERA